MSLLEGHGDVTMDRAGADGDPERRHASARCCGAGASRPGAPPACSSSSSASRRSSASTRKASASSLPSRTRAAPSCSSAPGGGRSGCPPWSRSATLRHGSPVSAPPPPSPADLRADRGDRRAPRAAAPFPLRARALVCGVSGGPDSLALLVLAVASGCTVTAVHVDHGLRAGSAEEADVVADAARRFGAAFRSARVELDDGPNLEARARARAARRARLRRGHRAHRRRPGRDGARQPARGVRASTDSPAMRRRDRRTPCSPSGGQRRRSSATASGWCPCATPRTTTPASSAAGSAAELLPLCAAIAGRDVVPVLARQAELFGRRRRRARRRSPSLIDPADRRARGRRSRAARPPGGPCVADRRRALPAVGSTRSSGCSRWPARSAGPPKSPGGGGSAARTGGLVLGKAGPGRRRWCRADAPVPSQRDRPR